MNLFKYVQNNPTNYADPYGLQSPQSIPWWMFPLAAGPEFWWVYVLIAVPFIFPPDLGNFQFPEMSWPWQGPLTNPAGQVCPLNGTWGNGAPPPPVLMSQGKGERNWAGSNKGTNNPYKGWRDNGDGTVTYKDKQTGKKVTKPKPPDFDQKK